MVPLKESKSRREEKHNRLLYYMDMTIHLTNFSLKEKLAGLVVYREYIEKAYEIIKNRYIT